MSWENVDDRILLAVRMLIGDDYLLINPDDQEFINKVGTIRFNRPGRYLMPLTKEYIKEQLAKIKQEYKELNYLGGYTYSINLIYHHEQA